MASRSYDRDGMYKSSGTGMKGVGASKNMMPSMNGYKGQYRPPEGPGEYVAKGVYSNKSNPLSVPRKGSSIVSNGYPMTNGDRTKVMGLKNEQLRKESYRGH